MYHLLSSGTEKGPKEMANDLTKHVTHRHIKVPSSRFAVLFLPQNFNLKYFFSSKVHYFFSV